MELSDLQQKCNLLMEENKELRNRVSTGAKEPLSPAAGTSNFPLVTFQLMQYEPSPEGGAAE